MIDNFPNRDKLDDPWNGPPIKEHSDDAIAYMCIKWCLIGIALGAVVSHFI